MKKLDIFNAFWWAIDFLCKIWTAMPFWYAKMSALTLPLCPKCGAPLSTASAECGGCLLGLALEDSGETCPHQQKPIPQEDKFILGDFLGNGGQGEVYVATHKTTGKKFALKIVKIDGHERGAGRTRRIERFKTEARALQNLDHPSIVRIYEVDEFRSGEYAGLPFFTMELIEEPSLAQKLEKGGFILRQDAIFKEQQRKIAGLVRKIAMAVDYAHKRGILHRDIKPSNILFKGNEPCIADFGLAKFHDSDFGLTTADTLLGSPSYMSPEQAVGKTADVTTMSDVWSLGVVLWQMLAGGALPFTAESELAVLNAIRDKDKAARPLCVINPGMDQDLAAICERCLEKDPKDRLKSAGFLSDELGRYLNGEPILTRPSSGRERITKWSQRNPLLATALSMLFLAVVLGVAAWERKREEVVAERDRTKTALAREQKQRIDAEQAREEVELDRAEQLLSNGEFGKAVAWLARIVRRNTNSSIAAERLMSAITHRKHIGIPTAKLKNSNTLTKLTFSDDEALILGTDGETRVNVWRAGNGELAGPTVTPEYSWGQMRVLPRIRATISHDGQYILTAVGTNVQRWNVANGQRVGVPLAHKSQVVIASFDGDGKFVLTATHDQVTSWLVPSGKEIDWLRKTKETSDSVDLIRPRNAISWVRNGGEALNWNVHEFYHSSRWLGWSDRSDPCWLMLEGIGVGDKSQIPGALMNRWAGLRDPRAGNLIRRIEGLKIPLILIGSFPFSPDGKLVITVGDEATKAELRDVDSGLTLAELHHEAKIIGALFNPNGRELLTTATDGTAQLWDTGNGDRLATLQHTHKVDSAAFSPDGERLATSCGLTAQLWDLRTRENVLTFANKRDFGPRFPDGAFCSLSFSADGQRVLAIVHTEGHNSELPAGIRLFDGHTGQLLASSGNELFEVGAFSGSGSHLVTTKSANAAVFDLRRGVASVDFHHSEEVVSATLSADGNCLITAAGQMICRWNLTTGLVNGGMRCSRACQAGATSISPNGQFVAVSDGTFVHICDLNSGTNVVSLQSDGRVNTIVFSSTGTQILAASEDGITRIWDTKTGEERARLYSTNFNGSAASKIVQGATFSRDGDTVMLLVRYEDTLLVRPGDPSVRDVVIIPKVWHLDSGNVGQLSFHSGIERHVVTNRAVALCPNGRFIAVPMRDNTNFKPILAAQVFDTKTMEPIGPLLWNGSDMTSVAFVSNNGRVIVGGSDGNACIWDGRSGKLVTEPLPHGESVEGVAASADGARVITWGETFVRVWNAVTGQPLTESLEQYGAVKDAAFSCKGDQILVTFGSTARVWDCPVGVKGPLLAEVADAIGGATFNDREVLVLLSLEQIMGRLNKARMWSKSSTNELGKWLRWLLADVESRSASPNCKRSFTQLLAHLDEVNTQEGLRELIFLSPRNAPAIAKLALAYVDDPTALAWEFEGSTEQDLGITPGYVPIPNQTLLREAEYLSRYAVALAPTDTKVGDARVKVLFRFTNNVDNLPAVERAVELEPNVPGWWLAKSTFLSRCNRVAEALLACRHALELLSPNNPAHASLRSIAQSQLTVLQTRMPNTRE